MLCKNLQKDLLFNTTPEKKIFMKSKYKKYRNGSTRPQYPRK